MLPPARCPLSNGGAPEDCNLEGLAGRKPPRPGKKELGFAPAVLKAVASGMVKMMAIASPHTPGASILLQDRNSIQVSPVPAWRARRTRVKS